MKQTSFVLLRVLGFILTAFVLAGICHAEPAANTGVAYYAIQSKHWPCERSYRALDGVSRIRLSFLYNTFGRETACLRRFLDDPRLTEVEIHLLNGPGLRNRRLGHYEFLHGLSVTRFRTKLRNKAFLARLVNFVRPGCDLLRAPHDRGVAVYWSPDLESNLSVDEGKILIKALKPVCPGKPVWNPLYAGRIPGAVYEQHGGRPAVGHHDIANLDGTDCRDVDLGAYSFRYRSVLVNNLWCREFNGLCRGGPFVDPRQRRCWPSSNLLDSIASHLPN